MMMPTGLTLNPTTATVIGNHQIMVVPIGGGSDKINNNGIPLITALQRASTTNTVVQGNDFNITRNVEPMHISSNDSSITLVETSDSDVNGKRRRYPYMCHLNNLLQIWNILQYNSHFFHPHGKKVNEISRPATQLHRTQRIINHEKILLGEEKSRVYLQGKEMFVGLKAMNGNVCECMV